MKHLFHRILDWLKCQKNSIDLCSTRDTGILRILRYSQSLGKVLETIIVSDNYLTLSTEVWPGLE